MREALDVPAPEPSLAEIHKIAGVATARHRLQCFMFGTVAAVMLVLTISGTKMHASGGMQPLPFADPRIPTPLASAMPFNRLRDTRTYKGNVPVPAPTPAPAPMIT